MNGRFYKFLVLLKLAKSPTFEIMKRDEIYKNMWRAEFLMNNNNCNLTTCRYNQSGACMNEEKRKECVEVGKRVLCLDGGEDEINRKTSK